MQNSWKVGLVAAAALALANQAYGVDKSGPINDPTNVGPPSVPFPILDLNGTPIPHQYQQYTQAFNVPAGQTLTNLTFAFREDPAFLFLDDVSLTDLSTGTPVPVVNGGFELGPVGSSAPTGWTYLNQYGASFGGEVAQNNPHTGSNNYYDGAVQAYDAITQAIPTVPGDVYQVSFWLDDDSSYTTFSRLSTNGDVSDTGGNGIDLLVYAGAGNPILPEPSSLAMLGGVALLGLKRRRKLA